MSPAVENNPACPATPPIAHAFSSCTSPCTNRRRNAVSFSVGEMRPRKRVGDNAVDHRAATLYFLKELSMRRQPRAVQQKHANGDAFAPVRVWVGGRRARK